MSANRQAPPGAVLGAVLIVIGLSFLAIRYLEVFAGADTGRPLSSALDWPCSCSA